MYALYPSKSGLNEQTFYLTNQPTTNKNSRKITTLEKGITFLEIVLLSGGALAGSPGLVVALLKETRGGALASPGALVVASLEETRGLLWWALVGRRWHHSRRRGDCSHVLTVCIQITSLKGARGVLWRLL